VDYATDKHATHVARALLVVVTGWDVLTPPGKKQRQRQRQQQGGGEEEEEQGGAFNQQQPKVGQMISVQGQEPHSRPLTDSIYSSNVQCCNAAMLRTYIVFSSCHQLVQSM
jgi:hypothetical protein